MSFTAVAARGVSIGQELALAVAPHGGQLRARRNALRALTSGTIAATQRAEVARATADLVAARELRQATR